jgi:hypothetical protein
VILNMILNCLNIILILARLALMFAISFLLKSTSRILLIMMLKISLIFRSRRSIDLIDPLRLLAHQTRHIGLTASLTRLSEFVFHVDVLIRILIEKSFVHSFERIYLISSSRNELIQLI